MELLLIFQWVLSAACTTKEDELRRLCDKISVYHRKPFKIDHAHKLREEVINIIIHREVGECQDRFDGVIFKCTDVKCGSICFPMDQIEEETDEEETDEEETDKEETDEEGLVEEKIIEEEIIEEEIIEEEIIEEEIIEDYEQSKVYEQYQCKINQDLLMLKNDEKISTYVKNRLIDVFFNYLKSYQIEPLIIQINERDFVKVPITDHELYPIIANFSVITKTNSAKYEIINECANALELFIYILKYTTDEILLNSGCDMNSESLINLQYIEFGLHCANYINLLLKSTHFLMTEVMPLKELNNPACNAFIEKLQKNHYEFSMLDESSLQFKFVTQNMKMLTDAHIFLFFVKQYLIPCDLPLYNESFISKNDVHVERTSTSEHLKEEDEKVKSNNADSDLTEKNKKKITTIKYNKYKMVVFSMLNSKNELELKENCIAFVENMFENIDEVFTHRTFNIILTKFEKEIRDQLKQK